MNCLLCEQRTVYLNWRKSVQCLHNGFVGNFHRFLDSFSFYHLGRHAAGRNGCTAAKCFKFYILDDLVVIDIQVNTHNIAAFCVADGTHTAGIFNLAYISRMLEMIHYFL